MERLPCCARSLKQHSLAKLDEASAPWAAIRWTNEWDNPDGTIERGYAGPSIFFENGKVRDGSFPGGGVCAAA